MRRIDVLATRGRPVSRRKPPQRHTASSGREAVDESGLGSLKDLLEELDSGATEHTKVLIDPRLTD